MSKFLETNFHIKVLKFNGEWCALALEVAKGKFSKRQILDVKKTVASLQLGITHVSSVCSACLG